MTKRFDLVILGSGSTAFAAALRARELGRTAVMIEERTVGGACVNRGCLPSKNLIEAARLVHEAAHPRYPGLQPAHLQLDFRTLVRQKDEVVADYRRRKYESLLDAKLRVIRGHGQFIDPHTLDVAGARVAASLMLIATGSRPVLPDVAGLSEVPYLTSDLLTSAGEQGLQELPGSLLVLGGGYIALELGQLFRRLGSAVTVLERSAELLGQGYEPEVGPAVREHLVQEGVEVLTKAVATEVRGEGSGVAALVLVDGVRRWLRADRLLVATGRRPNSDRIAVENAGVAVDERGDIRVDEQLRTSVPHIFAAGDVIGRQQASRMATPVGSQDGGIAAHNALSGDPPRVVSHRVVPRAIFIDPPLATVGMTEAQAVAAGHPCWCRTVPMSLVPRAGAIRATRGFVKMVADRDTDDVLGVTMFGPAAAEVIHEAAMGLRLGAKLQDFIELLHVYPTMSEALKIAAISRFKDPTKLSCCAQ
ncbi:MAG: mercury(II) reductase [Deltaproteobacteria bacterium]|nr:mercury(II) reductase [Deltaproteobacteria bacterium]